MNAKSLLTRLVPLTTLLFTAVTSVAQTEPPPPDAPIANAGEVKNSPKKNPCGADAAQRLGWLDRLQQSLSTTVCGSAVWFDGFFGDTSEVDPNQFYGNVGLGFLYKTNLDWEGRSRFDVNLPLRNLQRKTNLFIGRADEDSYISNTSYGPGDEIGAIGSQTGEDWLLGLGYSPVGGGNSRMEYKLGARASSNPYVFGQARYRYVRSVSVKRKWHAEETLFYRTDNDGFGTTTSFTYDSRLRPRLLGRASATATISQDTEGVKWKYQMIVYENLGGAVGRERAIAYKALIRGETEAESTIPEYGALVTYRQQVLRPWLFAETTLGYTWDKEEGTDYQREGSVNIGLLFDIRFGTPATAKAEPKAVVTQ